MKNEIDSQLNWQVQEAMEELGEMLDQIDHYLCDIEAGISYPLDNMKVLHSAFMKNSLIKMWLSEDMVDYLYDDNSGGVEGWEELYLKAVRLEAECFLFYEKYQFNKKFASKESRDTKLTAVADLVMEKISDTLAMAENHLSKLESDDIFTKEKQEILSLYRLLLPSAPLLLIGTEPEERDIIALAHRDNLIDKGLYDWLVENASKLQKRIETKILELGDDDENDGGFGTIEIESDNDGFEDWEGDEGVDEIVKLINARGSKVLS